MKTKSILIVEDDETIAELLSDILKSEGYSVEWASNGAKALDQLRGKNEKPSLILLDLMMPVMDGFKFREEQSHDQKIAKIPTVVMTAGVENPHLDSRLKNVASCFKKPINLHHFLQNINHLAV